MTALSAVCAVLTTVLAVYAVGHYTGVLVFLARRPKPRAFDARPGDAVAVLVPALNEGERALRVITSIVEQDHAGPVEAHLLIEDRTDTGVSSLARHFPGAAAALDDTAAPGVVTVLDGPLRKVFVHYTGLKPKSDKVNAAVPRLTAPYMAILDCDHQAHPAWLRSCVTLLQEQDAQVVQGRREPLAAHGFYRFWDSLHQHVGCELFNASFTGVGLPVFFTGTTAVLETRLLKEQPLRQRITEDTDFSYGMLMRGVRMISNPHHGSDEETSPDLYSFLARRRRWAKGHTEAFVEHLPLLRKAPLSLLAKVQFLFHGSHYLVSLVVFVLHLLIAVVFIKELSLTSLTAAALTSLVMSARLAATQRTMGFRTRFAEVLVLFGWLFPAVVIGMNLAQAALIGQLPRAALPIPDVLQVVGLVGLAAPLVVLLVGLAGLRQLSVGTLLATIVSWPVAFYLDISGVLLGMVDFVLGQARWRAVSRGEEVESEEDTDPAILLPAVGLKNSWRVGAAVVFALATAREGLRSMLKPSRWIPLAAILALFVAGVLYSPSTRLERAELDCDVMEHDSHPWIVPPKKLAGYCSAVADNQGSRFARRTGSFQVRREDSLTPVDNTFWKQLDDTFFCNQAVFSPDNVRPLDGGGVRLAVENRDDAEKPYTAASLMTLDQDELKFTYGRFETVMKPPKGSGLVTAFFLYRFDPWQEIDMEFVGRDTTKVLLNVYYNPGDAGDLHNYGFRGTPVMVDLGFDATEDFHKYAIEWEAGEIRWFVDDKLVHVRAAGQPTPIPHLPMRFHVNVWPVCSEELAGPLSPITQTTEAQVRSVTFSSWQPSPFDRLKTRLGMADPTDWRQGADWVQ